MASLQAGVLGNVVNCDGEWCELSVDDYSGYVQQDQLWGVYRAKKSNSLAYCHSRESGNPVATATPASFAFTGSSGQAGR